jgi:hypothetical protein
MTVSMSGLHCPALWGKPTKPSKAKPKKRGRKVA